MDATPPFDSYWQALWGRLLQDQQRLYAIQYATFSEYRARKLLALKDSEGLFYLIDSDRSARRLSFELAWATFTDEVLDLYEAGLAREDEPYVAGLEVALACQRGHHPLVDLPAVASLLEIRTALK